jgi:hypothetical protein
MTKLLYLVASAIQAKLMLPAMNGKFGKAEKVMIGEQNLQ